MKIYNTLKKKQPVKPNSVAYTLMRKACKMVNLDSFPRGISLQKNYNNNFLNNIKFKTTTISLKKFFVDYSLELLP